LARITAAQHWVKEQYVSIAPGVVALNITPKTQALKNLGLTDTGQPTIGWIARVTGVKTQCVH
jgi:hypothetical protein